MDPYENPVATTIIVVASVAAIMYSWKIIRDLEKSQITADTVRAKSRTKIITLRNQDPRLRANAHLN